MPKKDRNILTKSQIDTLGAIKRHISQYGVSPTTKEIANELLIHMQTVVDRIEALRKKGFIRKLPHKWRNIEVVEHSVSQDGRMIQVPVVASVGADNMAVFASQNFEKFLQVEDKVLRGHRDVFAVRALGNSMRDAGIPDGGYVFAEYVEQTDIRSGNLVVAVVEDKAVVKRIRFTENTMILMPENNSEKYEPIVIQNGREDFRIVGRVINKIIPIDGQEDVEVVPLKE